MKNHGSLINGLMGESAPQSLQPEVGMGATRVGWTDRHACTIVQVLRNRRGEVTGVVTKADKVIRLDSNGPSDAQAYRYEPGDGIATTTYTLRSNGRFVRKGDSLKGERLILGVRDHYYDYSF